RFGPDEQITAHCFDDLLKTRISLETQRQKSNVKDSTGVNECAFKDICDTFKTYCKAKNFFRPSHLETISQSTSNEILALFFDHYLTSLFNAKMAFSLPMQTIGDPDSSQYSFKKSLTKGKHNVQKVQEWKEKLTSMYQQLMHEENKVTSIFRDYLNKFVEEKLLQSKEK
ncbi:3733_t:CDS:1, partial [Gigaspora margarita]